MRRFRYLRFPEINTGGQCAVIIRIYRRKLFKLFLNRFLFDDAAPYSKKFVLRFSTVKNLRRGLRGLQLFERYFRIQFKTKKRQIVSTKLPGLFYSDIQEERSVLKDETTPSTRKRGKRYKFTKYQFSRAGSRPLSKNRSKVFSIAAAIFPGNNLISPKFLYYMGFTKSNANFHLSTILCSGLFSTLYHSLVVLNNIHLMLWLRRLVYINSILNANNSPSIFQR